MLIFGYGGRSTRSLFERTRMLLDDADSQMHLSAPSMVANLLFPFLSRCMLGFKSGCGEDWSTCSVASFPQVFSGGPCSTTFLDSSNKADQASSCGAAAWHAGRKSVSWRRGPALAASQGGGSAGA
jgi:hypothetical protein